MLTDREEPLVRTQIQLTQSQIAWLKSIAKKYHSSQAAVLRLIVDIAKRDYEIVLKNKEAQIADREFRASETEEA